MSKIESRRLEMATQYEKKLNQEKYRNVSKEGIIGNVRFYWRDEITGSTGKKSRRAYEK